MVISISQTINLLAPWLVGIGGGVGLVLAIALLYLRRHSPSKSDRSGVRTPPNS